MFFEALRDETPQESNDQNLRSKRLPLKRGGILWGTVSDLKQDLSISAEHKLGERGEGRGQESHRSNDSQACIVNRGHYRWQRGQNEGMLALAV